MARVRNLQFNDGVVEQPYFNDVPLKKWIHDDVVVWENGGAFSDRYFIRCGERFYCLNANSKAIIGTIVDHNEYIGFIDDYVWKSRYDTASSPFTFIKDESQLDGLDTEIYPSSTLICHHGHDNKFIATTVRYDNKAYAVVEADASTNTLRSIGTFDIESIGGGTIEAIITDDGGAKNNVGIIWSVYNITRDSENREITSYLWRYIDDERNIQTVFQGQNIWYYGNIAWDYIGLDNQSFNVNGKRIFVGYHNKKTELTTEFINTYFIMITGNTIQKVERSAVLSLYASSERNQLKNILYDKENHCYVGYYDFSTDKEDKAQAVLKMADDMTITEIMTPSDYLDIPIKDPIDSETHIRLRFSENAGDTDPSGYKSFLACKYMSKNDSYYNANGEVDDRQSITIGIQDSGWGYDRRYLVYIDNLYFADSENNFAIKIQ